MADHEHKLLGVLPVVAEGLRARVGQLNVDESISMHGFALSEVVHLEDAIAKTCWTGPKKEIIRMLGPAVSLTLKPLKRNGNETFEI